MINQSVIRGIIAQYASKKVTHMASVDEVNNVMLKKSWSEVVSGRLTSAPSSSSDSGVHTAGARGITVLNKNILIALNNIMVVSQKHLGSHCTKAL